MEMISYRKAIRSDISLILHFIKELARYEDKLDEVIVTEAWLEQWMFEENKLEVLFVLENGVEVGLASYYYSFATFSGNAGFFIEDLFILPDYRGKGYGKGLLKKLADIGLNKGCGLMEWRCLNWNENSIAFYESLGAKVLDEWSTYRVSGDALVRLGGK